MSGPPEAGGADWEALFDELVELPTDEQQARLAQLSLSAPDLAGGLAALLVWALSHARTRRYSNEP